ncbi:MAG: diphosphomevalonate decarboxylase [Bradymonadia bacterium]
MQQPHRAIAQAGINVALIKYWGKRDAELNLPAVSSLSLTLDAPGTRTEVIFDSALSHHQFQLNGVEADAGRVQPILDAVRQHAGSHGIPLPHARVNSENTVPTAAGLASSASGFAALVAAAWAAAGLDPEDPHKAELTRIGSGSAPRSLLGGFVVLDKVEGQIRQIATPEAWPLRMVLCLTEKGPKKISSRVGMESSARTSPYFASWVSSHEADMQAAEAAINARDLDTLGEMMEHSTLKMHACMMAGRPPLIYWRSATLAAMEQVHQLREQGVSAWYTMDAGPHVKVLCAAEDAEHIASTLKAVPGVSEVLVAAPGPGAQVETC